MRYCKKEMDEIGQSLSKQQGQLFVESIDRYIGSSYVFIKTFMQSKLAIGIDDTCTLNIPQIFEEMDKYLILNKGEIKINKDIIYWTGYIYRYWAYTYGIDSKTIYSIANSQLMEQLYGPYHTLDPDKAILRIMEDEKIDLLKDDSLELLKRIYDINS